MTIVSGVLPALGVPVPHWFLWLLFGVGAILICWSPVIAFSKNFRKMDAPQILLVVGLAGVVIFAGTALGGAIWALNREGSPDLKAQGQSPQVDAPKQLSAAAPAQSSKASGILLSSRFYSAQHKDEVSGRLDRISNEIKKADQEILLPARRAPDQRFIPRAVSEAVQNLEALDRAIAAVKGMEAVLYKDMIATERDYRPEMNAILLPNAPLINFIVSAEEYRSGISAWMKVRVADNEGGIEVRSLYSGSLRSFFNANAALVEWLTHMQELVDQTRRELR